MEEPPCWRGWVILGFEVNAIFDAALSYIFSKDSSRNADCFSYAQKEATTPALVST